LNQLEKKFVDWFMAINEQEMSSAQLAADQAEKEQARVGGGFETVN